MPEVGSIKAINKMDSVVGLSRAGHGDVNRGSETSAPVKDGIGEMGVYVPSFRARYSARHSQ